jgi:hypothetical protein
MGGVCWSCAFTASGDHDYELWPVCPNPLSAFKPVDESVSWPNLPAGYDAVQYEMISRTESTLITVHPGQPPFEHTIGGVCSSCMHGEHDFELWPVCPSGNRHQKPAEDEPVAVQEPVFAQLPEPAQEPAAASSPGTSAAPAESSEGGARVRWFDTEPDHAQEPLTPPETRWGPGPGAYW